MSNPTTCLLASVLLLGFSCDAFQQCPPHLHRQSRRTNVGIREAATARAFREEKAPNHFLLDEFKTHNGEIIDPYQTLKIPRESERTEIRQAYIALSKRYHPDGSRHRDVLPGRCNNDDDVREEWERIKLSYEILSDKRSRRRYDRHEVIADPGAAMRRAAVGAVGKGAAGVGKGLFNMGAFAVQQMMDKKDEK